MPVSMDPNITVIESEGTSLGVHSRQVLAPKKSEDVVLEMEYTVTPQTLMESKTKAQKFVAVLKKFGLFVGPGLMVLVAYMDPGNYATGITAGAANRYSLLFVVFLSNLIAIFLQILCIRLGTVTGYDLARCCREFLPKKLNYVLWVLAECAIIATDVAEVIGLAIALNILIRVPLPAGVVITIIDVLFVLIAYKGDSLSTKFVRLFEYGVALLVLAVVICFAVMLGSIHANGAEIFRGYVPSKEMFDGQGMTIATSVVGSTVMIHLLFLGSGLVSPRLREYDVTHGVIDIDTIRQHAAEDDHVITKQELQIWQWLARTRQLIPFWKKTPSPLDTIELLSTEKEEKEQKRQFAMREADYFYRRYKPLYHAIRYCLKYLVTELVLSLATFALFVNLAILIISGATLYGTPEAVDADLYTIHDLLSHSLAPVVGTIFMLALLFSGQLAGIVCTIAGQMVSEGHINWTMVPWLRRLVTRSISIIPCLIISLCIGRDGLGVALNISQVVISILLPPLTAPLIWFTCKRQYMKVELPDDVEGGTEINGKRYKFMNNHWLVAILLVAIWLLISVLNVYAIYEMAKNGV